MGTETNLLKWRRNERYKKTGVKLNNPLMGTETAKIPSYQSRR